MAGSIRRRLPRAAVALVVVGCVVAFFAVGPSESEVLSHQAAWKAAVRENFVLALVIFFAVEVVLVALSVPVATGLSVLAGVLLGRWPGTVVVSFASTLGALLATLIARYVLRDSLRRRVEANPHWQQAVRALDRGVERDGGYYLLLVRLTPVFPFFLVNIGMGLTPIRPRQYWWATQAGMLPTTFVVVSAGAEVGEVSSFREMASLERLWPFALLVVIPIALRLIGRRYWRRHPDEDPRPAS